MSEVLEINKSKIGKIKDYQRRRLENIRQRLEQAERAYQEIQNDYHAKDPEFFEEMENFHAEGYTLGHCLRWGVQAVNDILEAKQ